MRKFIYVLLLLCVWSTPAWAIDPDGTTIVRGGGGSLVGIDGTWTIGAAPDYFALLNGVSHAYGDASTMTLANGGHLYYATSADVWYTWNSSGGFFQASSNPNPASVPAIQSQVHNAPGWVHSHSYVMGNRVNNGPGWNEGTQKYVPYSLLRAYKIKPGTTSPCTSAASGGPTGTSTSGISDGTCTWVYLSDTDYVTLTGWGMDAPAWTAQAYGYKEAVAAPDANGILTMYQNENSTGCVFSSPPPAVTARGCGYQVAGNCNSTVAPPNNNPGVDNCTWIARVPIVYSSGTSFIPKQTRVASNWFYSTVSQPYEADLWNDQQYIMGSGNETSSYFVLTDNWFTDGHNVNPIGNPACGQTAGVKVDVATPTVCSYNIVAAPNESFVDTLAANPSLPLRYDPSYGVSIVGNVNTGNFFVNFRRLQMSNPTGTVMGGFGRDADVFNIESNIIEVGTPSASVGAPWSLGDAINVGNSLIISHGPDAIGYETIYASSISHSTIVNPEGTGNTCIFHKWDWVWYQGQYVVDTICSGFAHTNGAIGDNSTGNPGFVGYNQDPNNTNAPHAYSTSPYENGTANPFVFTSPFSQWGNPQNEYPITGMTYGVSPSGLFMGSNDYRISPTSPLRAAGANYGSINLVALGLNQPPFNVSYDAKDILGTTRPATGQDIGAWQTPGAAPTTFTVSVSAPTNGTVTSSPAGINCGGTCSATFNIGDTVTLTATPTAGHTFTGWGGSCISFGTSSCTLTTNSSVSANFGTSSSQFNNRSARFVARQVPNPPPGPPPTPILEMPTSISGTNTVDVGTGSQTIEIYIGPTFGNPRPTFYVVASDGVTDVQVTSNTTNPMHNTFDPPDPNNIYVQAFVFHGDWGININKIKIKEVSSGSMFQARIGTNFFGSISGSGGSLTGVAIDTQGRGLKTPIAPFVQGEPYGQVYYYFGPSTDPSGHVIPSKGYQNVFTGSNAELDWEPCNKLTPYIQCPVVYDQTETVIAGIKMDGVTQSPGTLRSFITQVGAVHTYELPSGTFNGTGAMTWGHTVRGQGIDVTVLDNHGIQPANGKAGFDLETCCATIADLTIKNNIIGNNAGGAFLSTNGVVFDHIKTTLNEDGLRGPASSGNVTSDAAAPFIVQNSIITDNGNDGFLQHEMYINDGVCMSNNNQVIQGQRSDHAHKWRCYWGAINGSTIVGCGDPFAEVCGSVVNLPTGGVQSIQGMYSETVGGTVHTGDVLTVTFHQPSGGLSDIVVTYTVQGGDTATTAATALLTALQINSTLTNQGFRFSAGGTAKSTDTSAIINIFGPGRQDTGSIANWVITPTVTGSGHTTTLTQSLTPTDITLTSVALVPNGTTILTLYGDEIPSAGGFAINQNMTHVHLTNLNTNPMRLVSGGNGGGTLNLVDCHYSGSLLPTYEGWDNVIGTCISDASTTTPADVSADGTTITPGGGGTLVTLDGHWTFDGLHPDGVDSKVMLDGVWTSGGGIQMTVKHGFLFVKNNAGGWFKWAASGPGGFLFANDPATFSADTTSISSPPAGSLTTIDGVWTFGTLSSGNYQILLNGKNTFAVGVKIQVDHGGQVYVKNASNQWILWQSGWIGAAAP